MFKINSLKTLKVGKLNSLQSFSREALEISIRTRLTIQLLCQSV